MLKSIKDSKINFWNKEYGNLENYTNYIWILKVPNNWDTFIRIFRKIIYKSDEDRLMDKLK